MEINKADFEVINNSDTDEDHDQDKNDETKENLKKHLKHWNFFISKEFITRQIKPLQESEEETSPQEESKEESEEESKEESKEESEEESEEESKEESEEESEEKLQDYSQNDKLFLLELYKEHRNLLKKYKEKKEKINELEIKNKYLKNYNVIWIWCYVGTVLTSIFSLSCR